jgi:hypothetical protein
MRDVFYPKSDEMLSLTSLGTLCTRTSPVPAPQNTAFLYGLEAWLTSNKARSYIDRHLSEAPGISDISKEHSVRGKGVLVSGATGGLGMQGVLDVGGTVNSAVIPVAGDI